MQVPTSPTWPVRAGEAGLDVDPLTAARALLGAVITARGVSARILEVEAYGGPADGPWPDPAAHSHRGRTARNAVMFGPPGRLYTYRSHGIHVCANVSCGGDGTAGAVLLRAAFIESGRDSAQSRRGPAVGATALARGPGNLWKPDHTRTLGRPGTPRSSATAHRALRHGASP